MEHTGDANRRMFQRVELQVGEGTAKTLLDASARWENGDVSKIYDMSYTGVAIERPKNQELKVCHNYDLKFKLGPEPECDIQGEVMWFNDNIVGLAFQPISPETRKVFNHFLDDKLIGANLTPVNPDLFSGIMDCQFWYQGPNDTNVYFWTEGEGEKLKILSAVVELDDFFLKFANGHIIEVGGGATEGGGSAKYSEVTDEVEIKSLASKERAFVVRVIGLLSQISEQKGPIQQLLDQLADADY